MNVTVISKSGIRSLTQAEYWANMPIPEGYQSAEPLPFPQSYRHAAMQCHEMGVGTGDTIVGREGDEDGSWWNETRLTLLWAGQTAAAFRVERRSDSQPEWREDGEATNWTLNSRKWFLVKAALNKT